MGKHFLRGYLFFLPSQTSFVATRSHLAYIFLLIKFLDFFPCHIQFCSLFFFLWGQPWQVTPALPSLLSLFGWLVLLSTHCHGCHPSLNLLLINCSFKSLNSPCYWLQNSLQVFGVFALMECKICTQDSRCALTHHTRSKRDQDLMCHHTAPQVLLASSYSGLSCCLVTLRLICNHPWPLLTLCFLAALCNWLSGLLIIFLQMY